MPASVTFAPDEGVLRLAHGTLSVLALLAADPVDPRLHDHDVAPHVAALRRAGVLGRSGVHEAVRPLTDAIATATATLALAIADRRRARRCSGWVGADLVVVAVPSGDDPRLFDLVADRPAALPALVDDLVGLVPGAAAPAAARPLRVDPDGFEALLAAPAAAPEAVAAALVAGDADARAAVAALAAGLTTRWALQVIPRGGGDARRVAVLDAGAAGLWREDDRGDHLLLSPSDSVAVHAAVAATLG